MKRDFKLYLEDIIKYIDKAEQYTENLTYEEFFKDGKTSEVSGVQVPAPPPLKIAVNKPFKVNNQKHTLLFLSFLT